MDELWVASMLKILGIGMFSLLGLGTLYTIVDMIIIEVRHARDCNFEAEHEIERLEDELDNEREISADLRRMIKDLKEGKTNV